MRQIVCISTAPWYPIPTRKQQVMQRLSDCEVLYFDPPVTYLAPLKDREAKEKLRAWRKPGEKPAPHVTVYATPPVLPFFNKFRWINRINQKKLARFVGKKLREHGFSAPLLWCYSPTSCDLIAHVEHRGLVYDCVDRHSAYGGLMDPALVDAMELELAAKSDAVFATAEGLAQRLREANPETRFIPNGADFERFHAASEPQPLPEDFPAIDGSVFGFVGALQTCIAYDYIEYAAQQRPDWHFVFIGGEKPGAALSLLKTLPNCHFLGLKPNKQLPQYMARFDVCLNLFADSDLSADVSPLKFFEYLATGKPIVSTRQPKQTLQYADVIQIASDPEDFVRQCEIALQDAAPARCAARIECGRSCSWDSRVEEIRNCLKEKNLL